MQLSQQPLVAHYEKAKGWDQYGKYMAAYDVLSADCLAINENDRDYINYRIAASKLLTVMELDSRSLQQYIQNHLYEITLEHSRREHGVV